VSGGWRQRWWRIAGFSALTLAAICCGSLYVLKALHRIDPTIAVPASPSIASSSPPPVVTADRAARPVVEWPRRDSSSARVAKPSPRRSPDEPIASVRPALDVSTIMLRITGLGEANGRLGVVGLAEADRPPTVTPLRCERLHFSVDRGVCLTAERRMFASYGAVVFDGDFQPRHQLHLNGVPSRVRVAPDGRHAAITVFVSGHSYAASNFSTRTSFVDLGTGDLTVEDMESFAVWRDGDRFKAGDFNFWGVTFARDGNRFYATLGTGGRTYLIEGDLALREARVLRAGVECPSLSPDNTRVAFKKRTGGILAAVAWRLSVLDLVTGRDWELAEAQSVDDQVEWLDDRQIMYGLLAAPSGTAVTNVWVVPADGTGAPRLLIPGAASPVVLRDPRRAG
jgi:hypothetical protein